MPSHSEGPGIWLSVCRFLLTHCLYERAAEVLARLRGCAGSPEPSLLAQTISTKFAWRGPYNLNKFKWVTSWENPSSDVCDQVRLKPVCSSSLKVLGLGNILSGQRLTVMLIRPCRLICICVVHMWRKQVFSCHGSKTDVSLKTFFILQLPKTRISSRNWNGSLFSLQTSVTPLFPSTDGSWSKGIRDIVRDIFWPAGCSSHCAGNNQR